MTVSAIERAIIMATATHNRVIPAIKVFGIGGKYGRSLKCKN